MTTSKEKQIIFELKEKIKELRSLGKQCFAIVATAGTTVRGAVDSLREVWIISSNESIWLHVDAAIGGVFA